MAGPKADPAPSAGQAGSSAGPAKPATGQPAAGSTSSHQTSAIGGSPAIPQTGGSVLGGGGPRQTGGEADPAEIRRRRLGKHGRQFLSFWLVYIYLIRSTLQQLRKVLQFFRPPKFMFFGEPLNFEDVSVLWIESTKLLIALMMLPTIRYHAEVGTRSFMK